MQSAVYHLKHAHSCLICVSRSPRYTNPADFLFMDVLHVGAKPGAEDGSADSSSSGDLTEQVRRSIELGRKQRCAAAFCLLLLFCCSFLAPLVVSLSWATGSGALPSHALRVCTLTR